MTTIKSPSISSKTRFQFDGTEYFPMSGDYKSTSTELAAGLASRLGAYPCSTVTHLEAAIALAPPKIMLCAAIDLTAETAGYWEIPSGTQLTSAGPGYYVSTDATHTLTCASGSHGPGPEVTWKVFDGTGVTLALGCVPHALIEWWADSLSAADIVTAFNDANTVCGATGVPIHLISSYAADDALVVKTSIVGEKGSGFVLDATFSASNFMALSAVNSIYIGGFSIDANADGGATASVLIQPTNCDDLIIKDIVASDLYGWGISGNGNDRIRVEGNTISWDADYYPAQSSAGINLGGMVGARIVGNNILGVGDTGIGVHGATATYSDSDSIEVSGNFVTNAYGQGNCINVTGRGKYTIVSGNRCKMVGVGATGGAIIKISVESSAAEANEGYQEGLVITDNILVVDKTATSATTNGIYVWGARHVTAHGNRIVNEVVDLTLDDVDDFSVDDVVTDGTSGATGVIISLPDATSMLVNPTGGNFGVGNVVTNTGAGSSTISAVTPYLSAGIKIYYRGASGDLTGNYTPEDCLVRGNSIRNVTTGIWVQDTGPIPAGPPLVVEGNLLHTCATGIYAMGDALIGQNTYYDCTAPLGAALLNMNNFKKSTLQKYIFGVTDRASSGTINLQVRDGITSHYVECDGYIVGFKCQIDAGVTGGNLNVKLQHSTVDITGALVTFLNGGSTYYYLDTAFTGGIEWVDAGDTLEAVSYPSAGLGETPDLYVEVYFYPVN